MSNRKLTLHMNVDNVEGLPQAGQCLADFLKHVDHDHGPFNIDIEVVVNPVEGGIEETQASAGDGEIVVYYVDGDDQTEQEGDE